MTTPSTQRKAGPYTGNGSQTAWPFSFKVFAEGDILVTVADTDGTETELVLDADYTVTLNANQDTSPGGTVNYLLPTDNIMSMVGDLDYDQPLDIPAGGNFNPTTLENELDRIVMQVQQLREKLTRALLAPVTSDASGQLPAPEANALIGWSSTSTLQNVPITDLVTAGTYGAFRNDTFTGTGAQTSFTPSNDPIVLNNLVVSVDGLVLVPGTGYTLTGGSVVFAVAPTLGAEILVRYGEALATSVGDVSSVTGVLALANGGTGADTAGEARTNLGATAVGDAVFTAANAAAARTAIGAQASGSYATLSEVVTLTGDQTVAGVKTFSSQPVTPQDPVFGTAVNTTSGTAHDVTGIPSWANEIIVAFKGVSTSGTSPVRLQLGSGSITTTGYESTSTVMGVANGTSTGGFDRYQTAAADVTSGWYKLIRISGNTWACIAQYALNTASNPGWITGNITLSGALDRLRFTTVGATDTFDGGSFNVLYRK